MTKSLDEILADAANRVLEAMAHHETPAADLAKCLDSIVAAYKAQVRDGKPPGTATSFSELRNKIRAVGDSDG